MIMRLMLTVGVLTAFLTGCNTTPSNIAGADEPALSRDGIEQRDMGRQSSPRAATGHFVRQDVEATRPDGSVSTVTFRANFVVFSDGRARGGFSISDGNAFTIYRVTEGGVRCDDGTDVVVLSGVATEVTPGGGPPTTRLFSATAMPVNEDNPACILWDIKDGCSHEAEGDLDVIASACTRP